MEKEIKYETLAELSKEDKYKAIIPQIEELIEGESDLTANLANISSVLKYTFNNISWVGFYITDKAEKGVLKLGPFQGKPACTRLLYGKGVCGTAAERKVTVIVEDVNAFPGHVFCDSGSKSEIVVPLVKEGTVIAVLDIDSHEYSAFDETDSKYLEEIITKILFVFD